MVTLWTGSASSSPLDNGVSGLVVGGGFAFLFFNPPTATGEAVPNLVAGFFEILQLDEFLARQGCDDRGFVDQRGQLSPENIGVPRATRSMSTSGDMRTLPEWTPKI